MSDRKKITATVTRKFEGVVQNRGGFIVFLEDDEGKKYVWETRKDKVVEGEEISFSASLEESDLKDRMKIKTLRWT